MMNGEIKTHIVITVDTEADILNGRVVPISKAVYGEVEGEYYGITKIMDICEGYNSKATFFVSTFESHILGENGMKEVCQKIYNRGHDVQLHTHPKWITNKRFMWNHPLKKQQELMENGKEMINKWIGEYPIAHRAGGFGADHNTLQVLRNLDIPIDSSYISSPYCKLDKEKLDSNIVQVSDEGVIELPVTRFTQFKLGKFQPKKPFDINANTLRELKFILSAAKKANIKVVTLLMHSFSFLKRNKDRTVFSPNKGDMKKFEQLIEFIVRDKDFEIITVKEFYKRYNNNPESFKGKEWLPVTGYVRSAMRAFRYINKGKGNQLIAMFVIFFVLIFVFLILSFVTYIT